MTGIVFPSPGKCLKMIKMHVRFVLFAIRMSHHYNGTLNSIRKGDTQINAGHELTKIKQQ